MEKMQIADLRVHSIAIADPPLRSSYGLHAPYALRTILELESEDGIVGVSETHGGDAIAQGFQQLRQQIVGRDAYCVAGNLLPLDRRPEPATPPDQEPAGNAKESGEDAGDPQP